MLSLNNSGGYKGLSLKESRMSFRFSCFVACLIESSFEKPQRRSILKRKKGVLQENFK